MRNGYRPSCGDIKPPLLYHPKGQPMTQHNYAATLAEMEAGRLDATHHWETIRHALKLAEKIMQEPSVEMLKAAQDAWLNDPTKRSSTLFKAMRDQALKEIE